MCSTTSNSSNWYQISYKLKSNTNIYISKQKLKTSREELLRPFQPKIELENISNPRSRYPLHSYKIHHHWDHHCSESIKKTEIKSEFAMPLFGKKDSTKKSKRDARDSDKPFSIEDKYYLKELLGT